MVHVCLLHTWSPVHTPWAVPAVPDLYKNVDEFEEVFPWSLPPPLVPPSSKSSVSLLVKSSSNSFLHKYLSHPWLSLAPSLHCPAPSLLHNGWSHPASHSPLHYQTHPILLPHLYCPPSVPLLHSAARIRLGSSSLPWQVVPILKLGMSTSWLPWLHLGPSFSCVHQASSFLALVSHSSANTTDFWTVGCASSLHPFHSVGLRLGPWPQRLLLSPLSPWLHLCLSSPRLCIGLQDLQCCQSLWLFGSTWVSNSTGSTSVSHAGSA